MGETLKMFKDANGVSLVDMQNKLSRRYDIYGNSLGSTTTFNGSSIDVYFISVVFRGKVGVIYNGVLEGYSSSIQGVLRKLVMSPSIGNILKSEVKVADGNTYKQYLFLYTSNTFTRNAIKELLQ